MTELRTRIDAARVARGLALFPWAGPVTTSTIATAAHVTEMRTALQQAYTAAVITPPVYTDPALTAGIVIKAVHFTELRNAVIDIELAP